MHQYAVFGGYPEPLIKKIDYKEYLLTLFNSILYKDIVKRYNLRATKELEDLVTYLLSSIASEYSYHKLSKLTKISTTTIQKYLSYMEETFIFFSVNRFSYKVKQQLSTNKKYIVMIMDSYMQRLSVYHRI
ncbi:ATP-binding protein [Candidatus Woesearchaeota archaeon]|nr:ATP-binding protein [Candidatus Woesearchaeota archaeon]